MRFAAVEGCCSSSWVVIGAEDAGSAWWYREVAVECELLEDADDELSCCGVVGVNDDDDEFDDDDDVIIVVAL